MTEQEKAEVIERAARVIHTGPHWNHAMPLSDTVCEDQARAALEAVGFFELVEAAERIRYVNFRSENYLIAWSALDTAITKAKAQTNDTHTD